MPKRNSTRHAVLLVVLLAACTGGPEAADVRAEPDERGELAEQCEVTLVDYPVTLRFDPDGSDFWDLPFPNDMHWSSSNENLDLAGLPVAPDSDVAMASKALVVGRRTGYPLSPTCYFVADGPLEGIIGEENLRLVDVDLDSPERGRSFPVQMQIFEEADAYHPAHTLAFAPVDGFILRPETTYACLVLSREDNAYGPSDAWQRVAHGCPETDAEELAIHQLSPLFQYFSLRGDWPPAVAGSLFTTDAPLARKQALYEGIADEHEAVLAEPFEVMATYDTFVALRGAFELPQFQAGTSPFRTDGGLVLNADGVPQKQGLMRVPAVLTVPVGEPPEGGFPVCLYAHGTGLTTMDLVDRGPVLEEGGEPVPGTGPALTLAEHGFAGLAITLPAHAERDPQATAMDAIPVLNPPAINGNFHQGSFEWGLVTRWVDGFVVPQGTIPGVAAMPLDGDRVVAFGHSLGSFYIQNAMAIEPRIRALVLSGAGGVWPRVMLDMEAVPVNYLLASATGIELANLTRLHPFLNLVQMGLEETDAAVMAAGILRPGDPVAAPRNVLFPAGYPDPFFPTGPQDALALAYRFDLVGDLVHPELLPWIEESGGSHGSYPFSGNVMSPGHPPVTGAMTQHAADEFDTGHMVTHQISGVRTQWGHFLRTSLDGAGEVVAP